MTATQLDLWGHAETTVYSTHLPGVGRVLLSAGGGWRARYTGTRFGWVIDRAITWTETHRVWAGRDNPVPVLEDRHDWEAWEPTLPPGVEHIATRDDAVTHLEALIARHGDDPSWLDRYRHRR